MRWRRATRTPPRGSCARTSIARRSGSYPTVGRKTLDPAAAPAYASVREAAQPGAGTRTALDVELCDPRRRGVLPPTRFDDRCRTVHALPVAAGYRRQRRFRRRRSLLDAGFGRPPLPIAAASPPPREHGEFARWRSCRTRTCCEVVGTGTVAAAERLIEDRASWADGIHHRVPPPRAADMGGQRGHAGTASAAPTGAGGERSGEGGHLLQHAGAEGLDGGDADEPQGLVGQPVELGAPTSFSSRARAGTPRAGRRRSRVSESSPRYS